MSTHEGTQYDPAAEKAARDAERADAYADETPEQRAERERQEREAAGQPAVDNE